MNGKAPFWFWIIAGLGLAWNLVGAMEFYNSLTATKDSLIAAGFTPEQADFDLAQPVWLDTLYALGTLGGVGGSLLLLLRNKLASPVLLALLAICILLFIGNGVNGAFGILGTAFAVVMSVVVLFAAVLYGVARVAQQRGWLR